MWILAVVKPKEVAAMIEIAQVMMSCLFMGVVGLCVCLG